MLWNNKKTKGNANELKSQIQRQIVWQLTQRCPPSSDATGQESLSVSKPLFDLQAHSDF